MRSMRKARGRAGCRARAGPGRRAGGAGFEGGYRVYRPLEALGSGSPEASWMLGSFQILDDGKPRLSPEGKPLYWRGFFFFRRAEVEIVPGKLGTSRGLRGTGSFDWTVHDVFFCRNARTMVHAGRAARQPMGTAGPGVTYSLPTQMLDRTASTARSSPASRGRASTR